MKTLSLLLVFLFANSSLAAGYYGRFWRGERKEAYPALIEYCDDAKADCFVDLINQWLIPATPSYAAEKALRGYAPVLLPEELAKKYQDEFALILYSSEKDYKALRGDKKNLEGSTYGPIHGDIFESGKKGSPLSSRSLVPGKYEGMIELQGALKEVSYEVVPNPDKIPESFGLFGI